jgi:outer membrane protein TolC
VYIWAESNYPLIKRAQLIRQTENYNLANIAKGYLPQVNATAQATYQSDVTSVPFANVGFEPLSKDQYRAYADVSQILYDGGAINAQKNVQRVNSALETANLQKDLYQIRERINQMFFGALLLQTQIEQANLLINQLSETKVRVDSAVKNGAAFKSDANQLQSEILIQQQRIYDLEGGLGAYIQMLSAFTGKQINSVSKLVKAADKNVWLTGQNNRPELKVFDLRSKLYHTQIDLLRSKARPRLSLFGQGGYGKPGLNQLKNEFDWFYIAGVRLNWNFSALYTSRNEKNLLQLNQQENNVQRETFLFNNNLSQLQQNNEKAKTEKLIAIDEEIIRLKESISQAAKAKYDNGVITLNDYLKEINAVNAAKLNLQLHKIQALSNQYNRQFTIGN